MASEVGRFFRNLHQLVAPPNGPQDATWRFEALWMRLVRIGAAVSCQAPFSSAIISSKKLATQDEIRKALRLLRPKKLSAARKSRIGGAGDGGYIMVDDVTGVVRALSFGINRDDGWDAEMAQRGIPVEQFDHTIESAPTQHPLLHFHRKMIAAIPGEGQETIPALVAAHSRGEGPDLVLKIDIDGGEWRVFDDCPADVLGKFAQIVCEFHDLVRLHDASFLARARRVFEKLEQNFDVIHVHGNNYAAIVNVANIALPDVLEVTFVNRARFPCEETDEVFPTALDAPCRPGFPDIFLGSFRF
jgi:hypothetical protein